MISTRKDSSQASGCVAVIRPGNRPIEEPPHSKKMTPIMTVSSNEAWLDAFHAAMRPFTSDESFQSFVDGAETDYLRAYYGTNLERLVEVKRRYDPGNLFRFPQSIPLSL